MDIQQALASARPLLEGILASTPDRILLYDTQGRFLFANKAGQAFLNFHAADFIGKTWKELGLPEEIGQPFEARLTQVLQTQTAIRAEEILSFGHGDPEFLETILSPILNDRHEAFAVLNIVRDISERKKLEQEIRNQDTRYRQLFDEAADGIFQGAPDGTIVAVNPKGCELTGYSAEELLGQNMAFLFTPEELNRVRFRYDELNAGKTVISERFLLKRNGAILPIEMNTRRIEDKTYLSFFRDISARLTSEQILRRQEEQYRNLFYTMAQGVVYQDADGKILTANPAAEQILGLSLDQMMGRTSFDSRWACIHEDGTDFPGSEHPAMVALHTGSPVQNVILGIFHPKECNYRWAVVNATPEFLPNQTKPWRVFATITDITELKAAQDGHRLAAQRLQGVVNNTQAVIYQLDPEGRFLLSEGRDLATLGLSPGQVVGLSALDMYRDYPDTLQAIQRALAGEAGHVVLEVRGLFFDTYLSPVFDRDGFLESVIGVSTNITERVKTQRALQDSQQKFSRLFDLTPDLLTLARLSDGAFLDINQGFEKATGHKRSEIIGRSAIEIGLWRNPADRENLIHAMANQGECQGMEFVLNKKDGTPFHVLISAKTLEIQGEPCVLVVAGDITQRVRTEQALRDSEENFRDLILKLGEGFCLVDAEETFTFVNPAAEAIFGVGEGQLVGRCLLEFLDPESSDKIRDLIHHPRPGEKESYELTIRRPNQELRQILVNATTLVDANGAYAGANGVFQDITERRQAEDVLRQTQKLESLGVLAGGIAHDFNNLLSAILGNLNLAQTFLPETSEALPFLENVETTVLRAADLTKQMLAYSGKGRFVVTVHNLNQIVQEMTRLLQVSIPKKTTLRFQFSQDILPIEADAAQIHQVVMNLVTNASEAIGQAEGAITVATHVETIGSEEIPAATPGQSLAAGTYAVLEISDSGCGMGSDVIERIFDPFFSTKASGRGLGLSAMLGILRGHKAGIQIQSQIGEGTTFTIYFPTVSENLQTPGKNEEKSQSQFTGEVLVVDDEPMVLEFMSQALTKLGFQITQACDGLEAVELFAKTPQRFDLVILDLTMPRMDGREALQEIRRLRPNTPVILCSGYSDQEFFEDAVSEKGLLFLQKPYQLKDLKLAIRNLLKPHET